MNKNKKSNGKKSSSPKIKDLNAEQRRQAILKQKHSEAIALHIVGKLIDSPVEEDVFLQSLKYLNQCHYQDIAEERAITKICGYPICANIIPEMPAKKYHISFKQNKIYDITDRKNYCSNFCYKAGIYIKDQMLTSPLWFREREGIPNFQLLPKTENGIPGKEIDQGILKIADERELNFTSVTKFAEVVLNDIPDVCNSNQNDFPDTIIKPASEVVSKEDKITNGNSISSNDNIENVAPLNSEVNNFFYSKMFVPSLADILKENAKYFENLQKINPPEKKPIVINNSTVENMSVNSSTSKSKHLQLKGILSNKYKQKERKNVSFGSNSFANETKELIITNITQNLNKMEIKECNENKINININKKNINMIKTDNILSVNKNVNDMNSDNNNIDSKTINTNRPDYQNINKNEEISIKISQNHEQEENKNVLINKDHQKFISNDSLINKQVIEHKSINVSNQSTQIMDTQKQKRRLNIKNSAAYARANKLSKTEVKVQCDHDNPCMKTRLRRCLREWLTFETIIFLYGEEHVKEVVSDKTFKEYLNVKQNSKNDLIKQKQYEVICKRLNLMQLVDTKFDEDVKEEEKNPVPHYDELKEKADTMDLRVKAFYSGNYEFHETDDDMESIKDENDKEFDIGNEAPAVLPLIDSKDLIPTRKRIFLTTLSRTIPNVCEILQQSPSCLMSDLKQLVNTMKFNAHNIVFKTAEWPLVAVLLIKILSMRNKDLLKILDTPQAQQYVTSVMNEFLIDENILEFLLTTTKIHSFLGDYLQKPNEL